ncbi:TetR/AcrR family transcriptional regulator [Ancylobacter mangrovi]|uniref:TetR/AcrR family transcriptional regulator n=1 Tax=Ancylobacter mangrovi TaxID=2972472 RepID=UPI0021636962|nr:TetR/AcrR family transcriptional regulator [Ancylobacter mangrovi]MCS0501481.1 TetR/AcrR family transcriptional regulator [Ancylobacter mangrovi]
MTDTSGTTAAAQDPRGRILDSFLALLAERPFERIGLNDVATRADVSLVELRAAFGSTFDMLSTFIRDVDRKVLVGVASEGDEAMAEQPARDRLFDVLMRRMDVLAPHKAALGSLARSARGNPFFALALNKLAVRSAQWMLAAAKIDTAGLKGAARAQGLALVYGRTLRTFLHDDDPGLAKTMSTIDRELSKGERALGLLDSFCVLATCGGRRRERPAPAPEPEAPAAA